MIQQFVIKDNDLAARVFENLESALRAALESTTTERMSMLLMPDGKEYTILQRPKSPQR